jgi:P27 family predicted phage terminase small subunit
MGKRGPHPKPTAVKELAGTLQPCRTNKDEWKPPVGDLPVPQGLDAMALGLWREKVVMLTDAGVLTLADGEVLEAWCRAVATARAADAVVAREGLTTPTQAGITTHPCVRISRNAWDSAARLGGLLGLDPSSRSKLHAPKKPETDTAGEFLSGRSRSLAAVK